MSGQEIALPASVAERLARALELYDTHASALPDPDARRDPRAAGFHREARAASTRRAYMRWIARYLDFCDRTQRRDMPGHASTMEAWAIDLCTAPVDLGKNRGRGGLAPNSVRQAMSAVRTYHRLQGENPPDLKLAGGIIDGHARRRAADPTCTDGRGVPGLRLPTLVEIFEVLDVDTTVGKRDRALLALGWSMMARRSELAALDIPDVRAVRAGVEVLIQRSKTDQLGRGRIVAIPFKPNLGCMCPATNALRWRDALAELGLTTGPYLRGVDKHGHVNGTGSYAGRPGVRLADTTVELVIARGAVKAHVAHATEFRGHSLRRGGATDAYAGGADILSIARHGGWGERSPVVFRYIEDVDKWKRNALSGIKLTEEDEY